MANKFESQQVVCTDTVNKFILAW